MEFVVNMTEFEYFIFEDFYNFHKQEFKEQLERQKEMFMIAYLEKHDIFNKDKDDNIHKKQASNFSLSELMTILSMVDNIQGKTYYRQIENK